MDATIIKNWNSRVTKEDTVFHIGDFCFKNTPAMTSRGEGNIHPASYYEKHLNGKIIWLCGSHDKNNSCKTCIKNIKISLGGKDINLVHDPKYAISGVDFNLVGHVHNHWKFKTIKNYPKDIHPINMINVGMDLWNFHPITIEEILSEYAKWQRKIPPVKKEAI
jgi:calcineurin-like phosphoesterase family protein